MPRTDANDGSTSICTQPAFAPIRYHWYGDDAYEKVFPAVRAIIDSIEMPLIDKERLRSEMAGRFRALQRGELVPIRHIAGPMDTVTGIDVFEVRGGVEYGETGTAQVRVYHVEPSNFKSDSGNGSMVVGLHAHHKVIEEGVDPNVAQNEELQKARARYFVGKDDAWGSASPPKQI